MRHLAFGLLALLPALAHAAPEWTVTGDPGGGRCRLSFPDAPGVTVTLVPDDGSPAFATVAGVRVFYDGDPSVGPGLAEAVVDRLRTDPSFLPGLDCLAATAPPPDEPRADPVTPESEPATETTSPDAPPAPRPMAPPPTARRPLDLSSTVGWSALGGLLLAALLLLARHRWGTAPTPSPSPRGLLPVTLGAAVAFLLLAALVPSRAVDRDETTGLVSRPLSDWSLNDDARIHPPVHMVLVTALGADRSRVRAASTVGIALALFAAGWLVGRERHVFAAGIVLSLLLACPPLWDVARLGRGYGPLTGLVVASWALLVAAIRRGGHRWTAWSLVGGAALLTEYFAWPLVLVPAGVFFVLAPARRRDLVLATGALVALAAFTLPFAATGRAMLATQEPNAHLAASLPTLADTLGGGFYWFGVMVLALALVRLFTPPRSDWSLAFGVTFVLGLAAAVVTTDVVFLRPRQLVPLLPAAALGLAALASRTDPRPGYILAGLWGLGQLVAFWS